MEVKDKIDLDYIDQLEENERKLKYILDLGDIVNSFTDISQLVKNISHLSMDYFKCDGCYYGDINDDFLTIRQESNKKDPDFVKVYNLRHYPILKSSLAVGKVFAIEEIYTTDLLDENLKVELANKGIISFIAKPLVEDGDILGSFALIKKRPCKWTREEMDLLERITRKILAFTKLVISKEENERLVSSLREKEERIRSILDSVDANVWIVDNLGRITIIGGKDKKQYENKFYFRPITDFNQDYKYFKIDGTPILAENINCTKLLNKDVTLLEIIAQDKKTKETLYRELRTSPIIDKDGQIKEKVVISIDIGDQIKTRLALRKSEEEARNLVEELKKVDEARTRFLSLLSHEFRNPLATIALGLDLMDYTEGNMEDQRKTRETLKRQTKQLMRLVEDLLNMTRMAQNKFELDLERLELNLLLEEVINDNRSVFNKKGIRLEAELGQEKFTIEGDRSRLTQVVENLLNNSFKFTPEEGEVRVRLIKDQKTQEALISIKDTGKGIGQDMLEDVFMPYVQVRSKQGKSPIGLGIGLSIVKDIIERHGGSIEALSQGENMGTEMLIRLPIL